MCIYCYILFDFCYVFIFIVIVLSVCYLHFFFFKQKTAYEMRISDWSSDVCSSDLPNGETWASRSGSIWVPLAARVLTTSPSFMVFQNMMMAASRFIPAMR